MDMVVKIYEQGLDSSRALYEQFFASVGDKADDVAALMNDVDWTQDNAVENYL